MTATPNILPKFLNDDEQRDLLLNAVYTATEVDGRPGAPAEELEKIAEWARDVRISQGLLENAIEGKMFIRWDEASNEPSFSMTPNGAAEVEELLKRAAAEKRVNPPSQSREDPAPSTIAPKTGESQKRDS